MGGNEGGGVICVALAFYPGACRVVSSIGTWWARFVMWVTTFPFLKFLPGFGTKYKFLDLDVFGFNILVGGGTCKKIGTERDKGQVEEGSLKDLKAVQICCVQLNRQRDLLSVQLMRIGASRRCFYSIGSACSP